MKQITINRFQFVALCNRNPGTSCLYQAGWTVEQLDQYLRLLHIWATDNLYRLPHQEGATVIIQSNAN